MADIDGATKNYSLNGVAKNFSEMNVINISKDPVRPPLDIDTTEHNIPESTFDRESHSNRCSCGCGGVVKGKKSFYMMGHDAKHKSALIKVAIHGSDAERPVAAATLRSKGWYEHLVRAVANHTAKELRKSVNKNK